MPMDAFFVVMRTGLPLGNTVRIFPVSSWVPDTIIESDSFASSVTRLSLRWMKALSPTT
jgi:hypothetical protein